ncbi:MAG TPA: hypothetical protein VG101_12955 [Puia sp.]|jgi:hypothetical protein|nr:hypothetical protein [Puia sp.]
MEFRTKMVVSYRNVRAYVAYAGLFVAASSLLLVFVPGMNRYIPYVFGGGVAVVVIGAIIARGDVRSYGLSDENLVVSTEGIHVGAIYYPMRMVSNIDFNVEAYNGMYVNDGAMVSGSNSDGMTNSLSFESGGAKVNCGFLLNSKEHVQQLAMVFSELYERHIPFVERNRSTRTYMFRVLNERELAEFKERYGYR